MKIIFLNTWHGTLHDELRAYIQRSLNDTDVFCFQEADNTSRSAYEDLLAPNFTLYETKRLEEDGSWYTNITYVHNDLTVTDTGDLFITQPEGMHVGLAGFVTVMNNNAPLTICNVHGIPQPGHKLDTPDRLYQTNELINTFAHHEAVVIAGDFNLLPEARSVQLFAENGYRNLIAEYEINTTRNKYAFERYPNNIQYFADFAFTSPAIKVENFVIPEEIVSDHQPLELYLVDDLPLRSL